MANNEKTSDVAAEYTAIRVASLRGDLKIPFDAFVRVAGKHILYCRQGDSFEGKRLTRLKTKKLKKMYIRRDDVVPYTQYLEESIDAAYDRNSKKAIGLRAEVIQGFQQALAEKYMEDPLDEFIYTHTRSSIQRFTEFLQGEPEGAAAILQLTNVDQSISHHGVNVAVLSVAVAQTTDMRDGNPLHLMALGSLIHDIDLDLSHFYESIAASDTMSDEARAIYRNHPTQGAHRLQGSKFVDQMVINIITQHEENIKGTGFPKGLQEREMDPLVIVVATVNAFDRLLAFEQMSPKEAFKTLFFDKVGLYPLGHLQALQNLLKTYKMV